MRCQDRGHEFKVREDSPEGSVERVCIHCDHYEVEPTPVRPRVVICISGGVVQDVHASDEWTEILIVDHDNLASRLSHDGTFDGADKADVLLLDAMVDADKNAVRVYEDKEPLCAQCENEFTPDAELPDGGYTFCSVTCHDRHWRQ